MSKQVLVRVLALFLALGALWIAPTQQRKSEPPLTVETLREDLHVIFGAGGNVGVLLTDDGVILVDDKFDRHVEPILAKVKSLTDKPVRYVLNTHHHGDHTGGNQKLSASADILMHENARKNLVEQSQPGLPRMTFNDTASLFLGGKEVRACYLGRGHTDGDAFIEFVGTGVIHTGDMFVQGAPYIDYPSGGSSLEWDTTIGKVLAMKFDRVIPGHGPISTRSDIEQWRKHFATLRDRMRELTRSTKSPEEAGQKLKLDDLPHFELRGRLTNSLAGLYQELSR